MNFGRRTNTTLVHTDAPMRTTLDIDEQLVMQAMKETGAESREAVVETALRLLLDHEARKRGEHVRGQLLDFAPVPKRPSS